MQKLKTDSQKAFATADVMAESAGEFSSMRLEVVGALKGLALYGNIMFDARLTRRPIAGENLLKNGFNFGGTPSKGLLDDIHSDVQHLQLDCDNSAYVYAPPLFPLRQVVLRRAKCD